MSTKKMTPAQLAELPLLTIEQTAALLQRSPEHLRRQARAGTLPGLVIVAVCIGSPPGEAAGGWRHDRRRGPLPGRPGHDGPPHEETRREHAKTEWEESPSAVDPDFRRYVTEHGVIATVSHDRYGWRLVLWIEESSPHRGVQRWTLGSGSWMRWTSH